MKSKDQESLDNLIRQTIGRETMFSFSRAGDSPVQWIHWLDSLDQQKASKASKNLKLELGVDAKGNKEGSQQMEPRDTDGMQHLGIKGTGNFGRSPQASDHLHSLKIPGAVVAFAQAAAKANDLPGWPLMTPSKVQMQKCDKCSLEFCSPLNYRRHIRVHRRPLNLDKEDLRKERNQVAAFWDKLTCEEAHHIVSFKNITLEDLSGAAAVRALSSYIQQPSLPSLPQSYVKAGVALLDIVQNRTLKFPLPSGNLFGILDDSSEKNFLCGVASVSMLRFLFGGEVGKVGLETKNLVATLGFLVEQRVVKAWMADKDIEALRCQKALVEEEEAAHKKREELQERKRLKKVRQRELKDKERKGIERSSSFQMLDIHLLAGGNGQGHDQGDESPTATQSSPSSNGYSGQELNSAESGNTGFNEFDMHVLGRVENMFFRLADEESLHDSDDQEETAWIGSSNFFRTSTDNKGTADSVSYRMEEIDNTVQSAINGQVDVVQDTSQVEFHGVVESQDSFSIQEEDGKRNMDFKMHNSGMIFSRGGRERNRYEVSDFSSYQKWNYGTDRRYYETNSQQNQKFTGKIHKLAGSSFHEYSGSPASLKLSTAPRHGKKRNKSLGMRRYSQTGGNGHAVWTRKVQQRPGEETAKLDNNPNLADFESGSNSLDMPGSNQAQTLLPKSELIKDGSTSETGRVLGKGIPGSSVTEFIVPESSSTVGSFMHDEDCNIWPKFHEKSDGTSSCDSSLSCDSSSYRSSASILATAVVEDQVNGGESYFSAAASSPETVLDCSFYHKVSNALTQQSVNACRPIPTIANSALFIGSLSVPLGNEMESFQLKCSGSPHAKLNQLSKEIDSQLGKKERCEAGVVSGSPTSIGEVGLHVGFAVPPEVVKKESMVCPHEFVPYVGGIGGDVNANESDSKVPQKMLSAGMDSSPQTSVQATGHEKLAKQGSWQNGGSKIGIVKVWRPVVAAERQVSTIGSEGKVENAISCAGDMHMPDVLKSDGDVAHKQMEGNDSSISEKDDMESSNQSSIDTVGNMGDICNETKSKMGSDERRVNASGCDRIVETGGAVNGSSEVGVVDMSACGMDPLNIEHKVGDTRTIKDSLWWESNACLPSPKAVASFLSERWADAVGDYESFFIGGTCAHTDTLNQVSDDSTVSLISVLEEKILNQTQDATSVRLMHYDSEQDFYHQGLDPYSEDNLKGARHAPLYSGKDRDLPVNGVLAFNGGGASKTMQARVHLPEKIEEYHTSLAASNEKSGRKLDRRHLNPKMKVLEPRDIRRQRNLKEKN